MNYLTETINPKVQQMPSYLKDKHYLRKHGKNAYYGQGKK
jgi:L-ribulose-5-phosphate 4-epimerase